MMQMMRKVRTIAFNTFKEAVRDRVLYSIVFFALMILAISTVMDIITIGQKTKIIKDMGLFSISLFGTLIAIFVGIGLVYKEIDKKTIYTIVAKPVTRYQFLLGKYLGLVLTIFVEVAAMSIIFFLVVYLESGSLASIPMLTAQVGLTFLELMVICAVAIFFSSFSTPILSGMFTLGVYVIGHMTSELYDFSAKYEGTFYEKFLKGLYYMFPNLDNFNIRSQVVHGIPVEPGYIIFSVLYGILFIAIFLFVSSIIFNKRDFK